MSEDLWRGQDTDPDAIEAALRDLLRERHAADRALAPARVLNLILVVDAKWKQEVSERLEQVGRYHASRTILCSVEEGRTTLDAVAKIAYEDGGGGVRPVRERVDIDLGPEMLCRLDTIVDPVLVSELPTMLWSPNGHDGAVESVLPLTDVVLLDSDEEPTRKGLVRAAELREGAYVVDLAWMRTVPWRERLASSLDLPARAAALRTMTDVRVRHHPRSLSSAALLVGWLASRLGWKPSGLRAVNGDGFFGNAHADDGEREIEISVTPVDQDVPGLAGVTVGWEGGHSLSLDRAPGGLEARECAAGGDQRWQVLGASRGEGGILGEGVRQALLRDSTYGPALTQALVLRCTARS